MNQLIKELKDRGLLASTSGNLEELLKTPTTFYVGTDPTADSLHLGHLLAFTTAKLLQAYGHKPIVLLGGATAFIGDPSFKSEERKLLSAETVEHNIEGIRSQVMRLLDFNSSEPNGAVMVNNYDWMKDFSFLDFAREVGKCITVNYMMAKDSVKKRLEREGSGMSFTEFTYQLLQGYDFVELYSKYGCKLQIGGSDQYGNGTTGVELVRKMLGKDDACVLTWPLVTKADGTKFGKSEKGNIWLDPEKTSPYEFYQFWLNQSDEDSERFIKMFTLIPLDGINTIIEQHRENPSKRFLQKVVAEYMTIMVHGNGALEYVKQASEFLFGKIDINEVSENAWRTIANEVASVEVSREVFEDTNVPSIELAVLHDKVPSKSEARKLIKNNGFSVNKVKAGEKDTFDASNLIDGKYLLLTRGKKEHCLVVVK